MYDSEYDLFEILLERSQIQCENQVIDSVVFFTCLRLMLFCDEVHDFRSAFPEKIINFILVERLSVAQNTIFDFINKNHIDDIEKGLTEVENKYQPNKLCKSLYQDTSANTYFNSLINSLQKFYFFQNQFIKINKKKFLTFTLNFRYTFFKYIIRWFKLKKDSKVISLDIDLYVSLLLELNIINESDLGNNEKLLDDKKCKRFVKIVTEFIFGIINISEYNCKLENKLPNLIDVNKADSPYIYLFIDQIGGTKNYSSVLNTVHTIINNFNFYNNSNYALYIIKTNANTYDAAAPTSLEKLIMDNSKKSNYYLKVEYDKSIFEKNNIQTIYFNKYPIIEFEFFYKENPLTKNQDIALRIYNYFGKNYNPQLEKIGGTKGEASKSKIADYIYTNFSDDTLHNKNLLDFFAFKTMGDFLQIISVKFFSIKNKVPITENLLSSNFITGDIICGYLGGIFLDNSILEKQTDDYSETLSTNLSLTTFYNINEIDQCVYNYLNLSKTNLSNDFKIQLNNIFIRKICHNFKHNLKEFGYPKMRQKTFETFNIFSRLSKLIQKPQKPKKTPQTPKPQTPKPQTPKKPQTPQKQIQLKDDKEDKKEIQEFKKCVNNLIDVIQKYTIEDNKTIIEQYRDIEVERIYRHLVSFLINNFLTELNISNLRDLNIDTIISKILNLLNFRNNFKNRDLVINYPELILTYNKIINYIKDEIKKCKERIIGGSSSSFGKYKKITKTNKVIKTKTRKSNKNQKYKENIIKLAKKYRISINKSTIKNIKNLQKLHKISKKLKINITKKNKNGKRIYKTIKQLENEINKLKKLKKLKKTNHKSQKNKLLI